MKPMLPVSDSLKTIAANAVGIDIVEVEEIRKAMARSERFARRVFTPLEIDYCEEKPNKYESYAARVAAKEAVMKALGTGWTGGVQWKHIEVRNDAKGAPYLTLYDKAKTLWERCNSPHHYLHLSLTHCRDYAVAIVISGVMPANP